MLQVFQHQLPHWRGLRAKPVGDTLFSCNRRSQHQDVLSQESVPFIVTYSSTPSGTENLTCFDAGVLLLHQVLWLVNVRLTLGSIFLQVDSSSFSSDSEEAWPPAGPAFVDKSLRPSNQFMRIWSTVPFDWLMPVLPKDLRAMQRCVSIQQRKCVSSSEKQRTLTWGHGSPS